MIIQRQRGSVGFVVIVVVCILIVVGVGVYVLIQQDVTSQTTQSAAPTSTEGTLSGTSTSTTEKTNNYVGAWFRISYPSDFVAQQVGTHVTKDGKTDEATFTSPDGSIQFYIYSPQWSGNPESYMRALPTETIESDTSTSTITSSTNQNGTTYTKKVTRYVTFVATDGSYKRALVSVVAGIVTSPVSEEYASETHTVFGIKYTDQSTYAKYLDAYLAFKKTLVQYAD